MRRPKQQAIEDKATWSKTLKKDGLQILPPPAIQRPPSLATSPLGHLSWPQRILRRRTSGLLFEHFLTCTVRNLAVYRGGRNPWVSLALNYSQGCDMFLHAILALSSAHIKVDNPELRYDGHVHYGLAMQALKVELTKYSKGQGSAAPLVLTSLGLALYEVRT